MAALVISNTGGEITLKLRVPSPPAQYTRVQGPAPVRTGVRCVQHFPFLGLLPAPIDGWSDITELYVPRYGEPKFGQAIGVQTCQHIDALCRAGFATLSLWQSGLSFGLRIEHPQFHGLPSRL